MDNPYVNHIITVRLVAGVQDLALAVSAYNMAPGQSVVMPVRFAPTYPANRMLIWKSDNEAVATVDQNGKIVAHLPGKAVISAQSVDNPDVIRTCVISVGNASTKIGDPTEPQAAVRVCTAAFFARRGA